MCDPDAPVRIVPLDRTEGTLSAWWPLGGLALFLVLVVFIARHFLVLL